MLYRDEEGSRGEFLRLLAEQGEEPAFVLRRRRLDMALETLRRSSRLQRLEMLEGPRMQLRRLRAAVNGDWARLEGLLSNPALFTQFSQLHNAWQQEAPAPPWANQGLWGVRISRAMSDLYGSVDRFNREWRRYLVELDLTSANTMIENYNQYYVLEKACAFGREDVAARGFETLAPLTRECLLAEFPIVELPLRKQG